MTGFELDPSMFPAVAAQLEQQRSALAGHTDAVQSTATGGGNPWGDDKQGSAFGAIYSDVLSHVVDTMASHAKLLDYAAAELRNWADDARATDESVASRLNGLGV